MTNIYKMSFEPSITTLYHIYMDNTVSLQQFLENLKDNYLNVVFAEKFFLVEPRVFQSIFQRDRPKVPQFILTNFTTLLNENSNAQWSFNINRRNLLIYIKGNDHVGEQISQSHFYITKEIPGLIIVTYDSEGVKHADIVS